MKAILVIDMPKSCEKCDYRFIGNDNSSYCGLTKTFMNRKTDVTKEIDVCCPLRPLPQERAHGDIDEIIWDDDIYALGFNRCLHEITGETE